MYSLPSMSRRRAPLAPEKNRGTGAAARNGLLTPCARDRAARVRNALDRAHLSVPSIAVTIIGEDCLGPAKNRLRVAAASRTARGASRRRMSYPRWQLWRLLVGSVARQGVRRQPQRPRPQRKRRGRRLPKRIRRVSSEAGQGTSAGWLGCAFAIQRISPPALGAALRGCCIAYGLATRSRWAE